jgi:predicted  nucleic acid-binding Zn-ribbon protein
MSDQEKTTFEKRIQSEIEAWNKRIEELRARAERVAAERKAEYFDQVEELQSRRTELEQRLSELRNSGETAFNDFKEGVENAANDLRDAVDRALERFK